MLRREGTRLDGRGACDMKGFDATTLLCAGIFTRTTKAAGAPPLHLRRRGHPPGRLDTIRRFGADPPRPGMVIVGEPTNMGVADAHKSVSTYHTHVRGHEAHSSKPFLGVSAACRAASS